MKAFRLNKFGVDGLALVDVPEIRPGPGQVLVKMRAWSLNYRDILVVRGIYAPKLKLPFQILSDGVGEIMDVGEGVTRVKVGERVAGAFMQRWIGGKPTIEKCASALGGAIPGVAAEYVVLDANGAVPVPEHLSDEEAAALPCAAVTAWHALVSSGKLAAGETVLVMGTGGVSTFALQFARLHNARIIATSSSDAKLERLRELGATDTINYKSTPNWGAKVRELTDGKGVDHVVEVGGAGTLAQSFEAVCISGRISLIGVLSGGTVNPIPVLMKSIDVQGIYVGSRVMFEAMNAAMAASETRPIVDRVFPFSELPAALKYMESGAHFGKIVLKAD